MYKFASAGNIHFNHERFILEQYRTTPALSAPGRVGRSCCDSGEECCRGKKNVCRALGLKPVINARGTFTIITGSQSLPEVKAAMEAASRDYVHTDELMAGVGQRLAQLTGAA